MPSPFPGMNPYLEQPSIWEDFHHRLITGLSDALVVQVQPDYYSRIDVQMYIHELSADERRPVGRADVAVGRTPGAAAATATLAAPVYGEVPLGVDIERHPYLEIRDRHNRELVTVVEVLSPSNKYAGPDREQYLSKRRQLLRTPVHLVEIDLLRGGPRLPVEGLPECDYCVLVSRSEERPRVGLWPIRMRDALPGIPIPLRRPHPDATVDLQAILNSVFDRGGYATYLYETLPEPSLRGEDAAWAAALLAAR